jgi:ABC-type molybdate transport system substrate-binding protein
MPCTRSHPGQGEAAEARADDCEARCPVGWAASGVATQQALEHAGIWWAVRQKVVYGENVRQALQLFESGNADVVLTANSLLKARNAELIPAEWHQPILQKLES